MTGSVMDGEDIVQEALFEAYRKLDKFDDSRPLKPWLFRIAHNRCIDFLRKRGVRIGAESAAMSPDMVEPKEPVVLGLGQAVEHLVTSLPPKERARVLLRMYSITLWKKSRSLSILLSVGSRQRSTAVEQSWPHLRRRRNHLEAQIPN
jgi:RNA polymerase sigma factor (sigma-70 family)